MNDFYTLVDGVDGISFGLREIFVDGYGRVSARMRRIYFDSINNPQDLGRDPVMVSALIILIYGERDQREQLNRLLTRNTRNIRVTPSSTQDYFFRGGATMTASYDRAFESLSRTLEEIFGDTGFPDRDPCKFSYRITPDVIRVACSESCSGYLRSLQVRDLIFSYELDQIEQAVRQTDSCCADAIIAGILATESRDHLSIISLSASEDTEAPFVTIANRDKAVLRLEAWKFLRLVEDGQSLMLHRFEHRYRDRGEAIQFRYNHQTRGEIVGRFHRDIGCLMVACISEGDTMTADRVLDQSRFILDQEYVFVLYFVLKRLQEDANRFRTYLQEATLDSADCIDIFDRLTPPPIHLIN